MPAITLTITANEDGSVSVSGPIQNKSMRYSMLECARDAVKDYNDKRAASPIIPAAPNAALRFPPPNGRG